MIIITSKFIVLLFYLLFYIYCFEVNAINYCEICVNHTLCKYNKPGPSASCKLYDRSALLTEQDILELIRQINERRNYVATGSSKILPPAANMKKILWSSKLATMAQAWADQCDPFTRPDREDMCRDLENVQVGQNIASISGAAPGLNMNSFVEMWFLQILEYAGDIASYNQLNDNKTNYFTQLIWANTELVGCGRVRFYIDERNALVDRLVCNFAPKGNVHQKPVYITGYPGTQCGNDMKPDEKYKGLCTRVDDLSRRPITPKSPVNNILKVLNITNNSEKYEINPGNLRLANNRSSDERRVHKMRHIMPNYETTRKRITLTHKKKHWKPFSSAQNYDYHYHRGNSRRHYEATTMNAFLQEDYNYQDFGQYDSATSAHSFAYPDDNRNSNKGYTYVLLTNNCCTRGHQTTSNCDTHDCCHQRSCHQKMSRSTQTVSSHTEHLLPRELCSRFTFTPAPLPTTSHQCGDLQQHYYMNTPYPVQSKSDSVYGTINNGIVIYDDSGAQNTAVRSGNLKKELHLFNKPEYHQQLKLNRERKGNDAIFRHNEESRIEIHPKSYETYDDYLYTSYERYKRQLFEENKTLKPFWEIQEPNKKSLQMKKSRYTTFSNSHRGKNTKTHKYTTNLEEITIKTNVANEPQVSEKYLSFDELMHLRRLTDKYADYGLRRAAPPKTSTKATTKTTTKPTTKATTTTAKANITAKATTKTTTPEYTVNTQFEHKKQCTRRLTCSWTFFTGSDGHLDPGIGSRTPPGYVDGCTRTSTCTRDFMDRNKVSSKPENIDENGNEYADGDEDGDGDYCEKKSLIVQRRDSNNVDLNVNIYENSVNTDTDLKENDQSVFAVTEAIGREICECNNKRKRRKRNERERQDLFMRNACSGNVQKHSYGKFYHWIFNKIVRLMQNKQCSNPKCHCNSSNEFYNHTLLFTFFLLFLY